MNNKTIKRSKTRAIHIAALTLAVGLSCNMAHAEVKTLSFSAANPPGPSGINNALQWWAEEVNQRTQGTIAIEFFHMGGLVKLKDALEGVGSGVADMAYVIPAYTAARMPLWNLATTSQGPGDEWVAVESWRRIRDSTPAIKEEEQRNNLKYIAHYSLGPVVLLSRDRPYLSPDSFKGDKVRLPGTYARAAREEGWNVTSVNLTFPDVYTGLQRGTIDGTMTYMGHIPTYRHNEVANHLVEPDVGQNMNVIVMNRNRWDSLSAEEQNVFDELQQPLLEHLAKGNLEERKVVREQLTSDPDNPVEFYEIDSSQRAQWEQGMSRASREKVAQSAKSVPAAVGINESYMTMLEAVEKEIADQGYPWESH
ncbi:TRAP transporter substrate-binding protein DctP [Pseudomonas sp. gcc21]|uniref:TRAP transporter substrate-binding protein DctP n=1 Tax=Pseudomonas sp. gcc21 TaxID=2726989 RepID=UPI00145209BE|nr:TRAP transporter substrate-binding protein DctP [Pseudomonas sp. gcc21]QJD59879.1 TRAP transporter substrate-binding protein DctP [Pseudomonas sp. gcc21]